MSKRQSRPTKPRRMTLALAGLLFGMGSAYVGALGLPHLELRALEAQAVLLTMEIETLEPGFAIAGDRYLFDPGLDPEVYGAEALDLCGARGSLHQLAMFYGSGLLMQGYDDCADMLLARQAFETGTPPRELSQIFLGQNTGATR